MSKAATAQTKLGLVIKIKGALFTKLRTVGFGTSVAPGLLDLSTKSGASPISFPFTKPKRFDSCRTEETETEKYLRMEFKTKGVGRQYDF